MTNITQIAREYASRPFDERFIDLPALLESQERLRDRSRSYVRANRELTALPTEDQTGLLIRGANGGEYAPTHWAFGQLSNLAEAPAGYLRKLPAPMAADCINYGLKFSRNVEEMGVLISALDNVPRLRAATGPNYGRIWNADIVEALIRFVGDGRTGQWRVPAPFNGTNQIASIENSTLFAGDKDMTLFLSDHDRTLEIAARRNGETGEANRGFILRNSEVGGGTASISYFLYDTMCANRIIWNVSGLQTLKIRHTSGAPYRWAEEALPVLESYARSSVGLIEGTIAAAQNAKIDKVTEFLSNRFGPRMVEPLQAIHQVEEGRPIQTLWDAVTGATAYARSIPWQDDRIEFESKAGAILDLVAA